MRKRLHHIAFFKTAAVLTALLVSTLATAVPTSALKARHVSDAVELRESYDYIVVGGGTAGLTIADRLSESISVLVVEYGDFWNASDPRAPGRASRQYNITSKPQPELNNRTISVGIGCGVSGSSAINGMAVMRGTVEEYDIWAELGNEGSTWNWEGMLPHFRKAVHFVPPEPSFAADYNITYDIEAAWGQYDDTRVYASYPGGLNPGIRVPGIEYPRDGHAGSHGVFYYPASIDPKTKMRSYSRIGHWDNLNRSNYDIITHSRVNQILFEDDTATAVQFISKEGDEPTIIKAKKEIILSAGAIHTPQILQLSGIGPAHLLEKANIPLKVDLPGVGSNFQDQPIGPSVSFRWGESPPTPPTNSSSMPRSEGQGQGLVAFLNLPVTAPDEYGSIAGRYEAQDPSEFSAPNTADTVLAGYKAQQAIFAREMRGRRVTFLNYIVPPAPAASPINLHIMSRGTVLINTTSPESEPVVDYRALTDPTDIDLMAAYVGFFRRLFTGGSLARYNATEVSPGASVGSTPEALAGYIRAGYNPQGWHPIGTAAKMRRELGGVVDDELRVYGVKGLRVADASVMPTLIGGTTQLTVYAIGEKAAAMIKETWDGGEEAGDS